MIRIKRGNEIVSMFDYNPNGEKSKKHNTEVIKSRVVIPGEEVKENNTPEPENIEEESKQETNSSNDNNSIEEFDCSSNFIKNNEEKAKEEIQKGKEESSATTYSEENNDSDILSQYENVYGDEAAGFEKIKKKQSLY